MNRSAAVLSLAVGLLASLPSEAHGQPETTIWDGVYTEEQAKRGEQAVQVNCAACHNAANWESDAFLTAWLDQPVGELYLQISNTMPVDSPGRLSAQEYADIVAYLLKINNVPAGSEELPPDEASLDRIQVTHRRDVNSAR